MLYPKIRDIEKSNKFLKILFILSIIVSVLCMAINYAITEKFGWSIVFIASIIYLWVNVKHFIISNVNIASHIMMQTISLSIFVIIIDFVFGKIGWSFMIAIPIILLLSNIIMLILTMLKSKKYSIYAIYQSIIFIFSVIMNFIIIIMYKNVNMILNWISLLFALYNLSIVLGTNGRIFINELKRRFHV